MKKVLILFLSISIIACKQKKNIPDVTAIKIDLKVERFEKDFFGMDTTNIAVSLDSLNEKYPSFLRDYLYNILGALPQPDSVVKYVGLFKRDFKVFNDSAQQKFPTFNTYQKQIEHSFQFLKYYFPAYKTPASIITFVGPLEGTANAITASGVAIGLQSYLGKNFAAYQTQYVSEIYPAYKTRRFEPEYIPVNCMKGIIDDMFPYKGTGRPLIEQMVETGKRLYVLDALLPETADSLKTGYTQKQLDGCYINEKLIWSFFVENNLLYETEPNLIGIYVNDGPNTPELGASTPGFIGQFTGWQIVKKWMEKNKTISLNELMKKNPKELFEESKYKAN